MLKTAWQSGRSLEVRARDSGIDGCYRLFAEVAKAQRIETQAEDLDAVLNRLPARLRSGDDRPADHHHAVACCCIQDVAMGCLDLGASHPPHAQAPLSG